MNKKITICMLAAITLAACSSNDDVQNGVLMDEQELTREQLVSDVPMTFAPVELNDMQWKATVETEPTRGGSVDAANFTIDSLGVFCLARKALAAAPYALSWNSERESIRWSFNEMAEVKGEGDNKGTVVWNKDFQLHYYHAQPWYTYCFIAYRPRTQYVVTTASTLKAYIKVDGNDDVIHAVAAEPETKFGVPAVDSLAFSRSYYSAIRNQGRSWDGTYPKFQFQHLMSRLNFNFRFDENDLPSKNLHVEKVEFDDFYCIMQLTLATFNKTTGEVTNPINSESLPYVLNESKLDAITINGEKLKDIDPRYASALGHFELREKGETPISGIREDGAYKYNLTSEFKKVGDCILIPPVQSTTSKKDIKLFVTLCDDNGKKYKNKSAIKLLMPSPRWAMGTCYDVHITLSNPLTHPVTSAPARRSASATATDGATLWQPNAKVTITARQ